MYAFTQDVAINTALYARIAAGLETTRRPG